MKQLSFEWDEKKNQKNQWKHRISFEEAVTVFLDEEAIVIPDEDHSEYEERFLILGISRKLNLLVVCHCIREQEGVIRIISARHATKTEIRQYQRGL